MKTKPIDFDRVYNNNLVDIIDYFREVVNEAHQQNCEVKLYTSDILGTMMFLFEPIDETKAPPNWWEYHVKECGTRYRGCAPHCPKDRYEETGIWKYNWLEG